MDPDRRFVMGVAPVNQRRNPSRKRAKGESDGLPKLPNWQLFSKNKWNNAKVRTRAQEKRTRDGHVPIPILIPYLVLGDIACYKGPHQKLNETPRPGVRPSTRPVPSPVPPRTLDMAVPRAHMGSAASTYLLLLGEVGVHLFFFFFCSVSYQSIRLNREGAACQANSMLTSANRMFRWLPLIIYSF